MGEWTDEQILTAIRTGIDDEGGALCATMPRFTDLGEQEGVAILAYLRSLPATTRKIPASTCAEKPVTADDAGHDDAATD